MTTTVVFGGGPTPTEQIREALTGVDVDFVIAADSGLAGCTAAGLHCDLVVGDMDSVAPGLLESARASGTTVERHDVDKDATDLEIALDRALERLRGVRPEQAGQRPTAAPADLLVIGSDGGRMDHLLASVAVICSPRYSALRVTAVLGDTRVFPVHGSRELSAPVGAIATLLALHGPVDGLTVSGMRWPLDRAHLEPGSTLGVSNVFKDPRAEFSLTTGVLTVLVAGEDSSAADRRTEGSIRNGGTATHEESAQ